MISPIGIPMAQFTRLKGCDDAPFGEYHEGVQIYRRETVEGILGTGRGRDRRLGGQPPRLEHLRLWPSSSRGRRRGPCLAQAFRAQQAIGELEADLHPGLTQSVIKRIHHSLPGLRVQRPRLPNLHLSE